MCGATDRQQVRATALKMLTRREYGRAELAVRLVHKGYAPSVADEVVAQLAAEQLVSDSRYVEALVRVRRARGFGPVRIRHELQEKGVGEELIAQALDERARDWLDDIMRVRQKRFGRRPPKGFAERARQMRFLQYRGFTFEQIDRVFKGSDVD
jgi:regulatory protein